MFDVGFWELAVLFGLGLIILGPERLPKVAAQVGQWAGRARSMARHLSNQIRTEMEPMESGFKKAEESLRTDFSARRPEPGQPASDASASTTEATDTKATDAPQDKSA